MTDHTLSPDELREIQNGSAAAWSALSDERRAEMASWGPGGTPDATGSKPAAVEPKSTTAEPSTASEIADASLTPEQRAAAEALLQPPARPQDYRLPDAPAGMDRLAPEDDKMLREFFHAGALNQGEATWAVNEAYRAAKQMRELARGNPSTLAQRTDDAIVLTAGRAAAELARTWGPDYEAKMAIARAEAARLTAGHPEMLRILAETTLGNSVPLIRLLVERAERRSGKA
jgi:hypothetical protein